MTAAEQINRRCVDIADQVVPEYRGRIPAPSCTGIYAKRWQAAYDGARIAIGEPADTPAPGSDAWLKQSPQFHPGDIA